MNYKPKTMEQAFTELRDAFKETVIYRWLLASVVWLNERLKPYEKQLNWLDKWVGWLTPMRLLYLIGCFYLGVTLVLLIEVLSR